MKLGPYSELEKGEIGPKDFFLVKLITKSSYLLDRPLLISVDLKLKCKLKLWAIIFPGSQENVMGISKYLGFVNPGHFFSIWKLPFISEFKNGFGRP